MKVHMIGNDGSLPCPPTRYGGAEKVAYLLAKELSKKDEYDITLYWGGEKDCIKYDGNLKIRYLKTSGRIPLKYHGFSRPGGAYFSHKISKILKNEGKAILHVHHSWYSLGLVFPKKIKRHKLLFTVHNPYHPTFKTLLGAFIPKYMHQHIINDQIQAWFFLRNSDCLSYVSNAVRNEVLANTSFRNTLVGNKKERIIYNCIDVNAYRNEEISDKNYILFVGRISKLKGLHLLLCAFKEVEKKYKYVKLIIAGDFNWSEEGQYFSDLIQKLNFKNLIIKDNPTAKELRELYGNCSFVVLPSIFPDPQPLTILEAYANCKPVIGSDAGGIPEMIDDCETGKIVQRGSVQALYDAMVELIENEEQRIVLGKKGFHKLMNKYTVEKVSNEYSQLYHELIYGE